MPTKPVKPVKTAKPAKPAPAVLEPTPALDPHAQARNLVTQVGTAYGFSVGALGAWDLTMLELYALSMTASVPSDEDTPTLILRVIRRNHIKMDYQKVAEAFDQLYAKKLVTRTVDKVEKNEFGAPHEVHRLSTKGERVLKGVASNLRHDLHGVGEADVDRLEDYCTS